MKLRMSKFIGLLVLLLTVLATSCKTGKESGPVPMGKRNNAEILHSVSDNLLIYRTLSSKLSVDLKPGKKNKNISVPASLRIIKSKGLQLSFQIPILNAELFRLTVTPDSILMIDRKNKMYVAESIADVKLAAGFAFDYYNLESLLTNQLFIAGKQEITSDDFRLFSVQQHEYEAVLSISDRQQVTWSFSTDYTDRIRKTTMESRKKSVRMDWAYDEFTSLENNRMFPVKMQMDLKLPGDEVAMNLEYSRVEQNKEFALEFKIPANYRRITLAQAIKIINSL